MIVNRDDEEIENRRLRAENARLRAALEQVEWVWKTNNGKLYCPWCFSSQGYGHADNCARQLAINPAAAGEGSACEQCGAPNAEHESKVHGCHGCGEERYPKRVRGALVCPDCLSENIVCIEPAARVAGEGVKG